MKLKYPESVKKPIKFSYLFQIFLLLLFSTNTFAQDEVEKEKIWKQKLSNMSICPFYDMSVILKHEDEIGKGRSIKEKIQELDFMINMVTPDLESKKQIMYSERMTKDKFAACWLLVKSMNKYRDELITSSSTKQLCEAQKQTCLAACGIASYWNGRQVVENHSWSSCNSRCSQISCN